jgi:hypothetical protein
MPPFWREFDLLGQGVGLNFIGLNGPYGCYTGSSAKLGINSVEKSCFWVVEFLE